jgi:N-methylhydantoinase B/oxoprolinase/acetone carboxylase alpha subunit
MLRDSVLLEIVWNRLIAMVEEQARVLINAAFSPIVSEMQDLAVGVFDRRGHMLAQSISTGTPGHTISMATGVRHFLERFPAEKLAPGDTLLSNDPWKIAGQLNDMTIVTPVFRGRELLALFASTCHSIDVGGRGYSADSREVFEEGLAIPVQKLIRAGEPNEELFELIAANVRAPGEVLGDLRAQIAANEVSAVRLAAMMDELGLSDLDDVSSSIRGRSDGAMRAAIRDIPAGTYRHAMRLDGFDEAIDIVTAVTVEGDRVHVDFTGSSPQSRRGINVVLNYTFAYTAYGLICAICPAVPVNAGTFEALSVFAPEGSILNARFPAPVAGRHLVGHFLPTAVLGALAAVIPDRVMAESSALGAASIYGRDDSGDAFLATFFSYGGYGARPDKDGLATTGFPSNLANTPVELLETATPLVIRTKELIPDSGGRGQFRGGAGQRITVETRSAAPCQVSCFFERIRHPAQGLRGGAAGRPGRLALRRADGSHEELHPKGQFAFRAGDLLTVELAGGAGFGPPDRRDPGAVAQDLAEGIVTA